MANINFLMRLAPGEKAQVEAVFRRFNYVNLDDIRLALAEEFGLNISRSAVGRVARVLRREHAIDAIGENGTFVVVVDRRFGTSRFLPLQAKADQVFDLLASAFKAAPE